MAVEATSSRHAQLARAAPAPAPDHYKISPFVSTSLQSRSVPHWNLHVTAVGSARPFPPPHAAQHTQYARRAGCSHRRNGMGGFVSTAAQTAVSALPSLAALRAAHAHLDAPGSRCASPAGAAAPSYSDVLDVLEILQQLRLPVELAIEILDAAFVMILSLSLSLSASAFLSVGDLALMPGMRIPTESTTLPSLLSGPVTKSRPPVRAATLRGPPSSSRRRCRPSSAHRSTMSSAFPSGPTREIRVRPTLFLEHSTSEEKSGSPLKPRFADPCRRVLLLCRVPRNPERLFVMVRPRPLAPT